MGSENARRVGKRAKMGEGQSIWLSADEKMGTEKARWAEKGGGKWEDNNQGDRKIKDEWAKRKHGRRAINVPGRRYNGRRKNKMARKGWEMEREQPTGLEGQTVGGGKTNVARKAGKNGKMASEKRKHGRGMARAAGKKAVNRTKMAIPAGKKGVNRRKMTRKNVGYVPTAYDRPTR